MGADVAVTNSIAVTNRIIGARAAVSFGAALICTVLMFATRVFATVLPEDRADVLYHSYNGGGVQVHGPSILVRKSIGKQVSVWANYYVDQVSSASVDVMATASPYTEKRIERSVGMDVLHDKTTFGLGYTSGDEPDYKAKSAHFSVSQDFFGDLTTVAISFGRGWDEIGKHAQPEFQEKMDTRTYRFDVSQILTRSLIAGLSYQTISDQGFLNNPYRSARFLDPSVPRGFSFESEVYPKTHTSNAIAARLKYYLPYRAALMTEYRWFQDTYGIRANDIALEYTHPFGDHWTFEGRARYYKQSAADFYSDLFPRSNSQNFIGRNKELAAFNTQSLGLGVSYHLVKGMLPLVNSASLTFNGEYVRYKYDDFRDVTKGGAPGAEPLFDYDAFVIRAFFSVFF